MYRIVVIIVFCATFVGCGGFSKSKQDFIDNFDLELTGKVINVQYNKYGQALICLNVTETNYKKYFPIHDTNKYLKNEENKVWEKRFFIKVEGNRALFIYDPKKKYVDINNNLKIGSIVTINENNNKSFSVYSTDKSIDYGGLKILTYPIRDNLETQSCWSHFGNESE